MSTRVGVVGAFGYVNGKLYFGHNHLQIATEAYEDGHITPDELPAPPDYLSNPSPVAWGWIWKHSDGTMEVEFYSDFLQTDQDFTLFDKVFEEVKKKYPKVTEMTMGPDPETIKQMSEVFDA
jgi:hypothetical protein